MALEVSLVVFTQTGNTLRVAEAMSDALVEAGHRVQTWPLPLFRPDEVEVPVGALVGIGSATFASRAPSPMRRFLRRLPDLSGRPAFVFATAGSAAGRVLTDLAQGARARGARVIGGQVFRGEVFHPAPSIHGRSGGHPDRRDLDYAAAFALAAARHVVEGVPGPLPERGPDGLTLSRRDALRPGLGFYDLVGLALTDPVLRLLLPEPQLDPEQCIRCGWCAENCPSGCIAFPNRQRRRIRSETDGHLRDLPRIEEGCVRCYRCLNCPVHAYSADWTTADRLIHLLYHPTLIRLFGDSAAGEWRGERA